MIPLGLLNAGEAGEVAEVRFTSPPGRRGLTGENGRCDWRIEEMGIRVGRSVEMLDNSGHLVLLKIDEARVALDRSLAMKVMIKEGAR